MSGYTYFPQEYLSQDFNTIDREDMTYEPILPVHLCIFRIKNNISQINYTNMSVRKRKIPYLTFHLEKKEDTYIFPTMTKYFTTGYEEFATDCYMHLLKMYNLDQNDLSNTSPINGEEYIPPSPILGFFIHESQIIFLINYDILIQPFSKSQGIPSNQSAAIVDEFMRVRSINKIPISKFACNVINQNPFVRTITKKGGAAPYPIRFYHAILTTDKSDSTNEGTLENVLETDIRDYNGETSLYTNERTSEHPIFGQLYLFTDTPVIQGEEDSYLRYACYLSKARYFDDVQMELNAELPAKTSRSIKEERIIPKIIEHIKRVNLELGKDTEYIPPREDATREDNETELIERLSDISTMHFLIDNINVCGLKYDVQFAHY